MVIFNSFLYVYQRLLFGQTLYLHLLWDWSSRWLLKWECALWWCDGKMDNPTFVDDFPTECRDGASFDKGKTNSALPAVKLMILLGWFPRPMESHTSFQAMLVCFLTRNTLEDVGFGPNAHGWLVPYIHYITLHDMTLQYVTLHFITFHYI